MTENTDPAAHDVDELRSEIAGTRQEMDDTITEIEERLDPRNALQRQKARVRERLDDVPVGAVAGGGGGLAALGAITTIVRRRRTQAQLRQQQREQAAGGAVGLGTLAAAMGLLKLLRSRRRRRSTSTVRAVMTPDVATVSASDTLAVAAELMSRHEVGALPVVAADGRLEGVLTDRDVVVKSIARGDDPRTIAAGAVATTDLVTIDADAPITAALQTMSRAGVRRLPVVDGDRLVGVVSQADLALHLDDDPVGDLVEDISAAPPGRR